MEFYNVFVYFYEDLFLLKLSHNATQEYVFHVHLFMSQQHTHKKRKEKSHDSCHLLNYATSITYCEMLLCLLMLRCSQSSVLLLDHHSSQAN